MSVSLSDTKQECAAATVRPFCELTKEQWLLQAKRNRPTWTEAELELAWEQFVEARGARA